MNFDQAKILRIQRWRAALDDQDFRLQNPEGHRETLLEMAATLLAEGLIDQLEQFEMNEMANAAYWHAVEELQNSPGHYRSASTYDVVQTDNGNLLGTISRSIFNFYSNEPRGASFAYDRKVYSDADGVRLTLGLSTLIEHITRDSLKTNKSPSSSLLCKLDHSDLYTTLLKVKTSIALRINDKEKAKKDFERNEKFLKLIELTHTNFEAGKFDETYEAIQILTSTLRELLKHEWNRARDGEKKYQEAKAISQWVMGTTSAFLMVILMVVAYESLASALATTIKSTESAQISRDK
jgi:hypothetical protein